MFKINKWWMGPDEKKFNEGFDDLYRIDQGYQIPEPSPEARNRLAQMQEMSPQPSGSFENALDNVFGKKPNQDDFLFNYTGSETPSTPLQAVSDSISPANIVLIEPRSFEDSLEIVNHLKGRKSVIVNLQYLDKELAQRVIDFVSGATLALDGTQERVGSGVFIFASINCKIETESEGVKAYKDLFAKTFGNP